jgi:hypothetical protein
MLPKIASRNTPSKSSKCLRGFDAVNRRVTAEHRFPRLLRREADEAYPNGMDSCGGGFSKTLASCPALAPAARVIATPSESTAGVLRVFI